MKRRASEAWRDVAYWDEISTAVAMLLRHSLQLETEAVPLAGEDGDTIKPLKLFAQINHKREKDVGVILSGGELKVRVVETLKADPFGAATVDVYSEDKVGQIRIEAM